MRKGICLIERLYVPYGQTVRFETLRVDKLIVDGNLIVEGKISAVICRGKGSVQVGDMEVDKLRLSSVTCEGRLKAREVISRRVYAESIHISKWPREQEIEANLDISDFNEAIAAIDEVRKYKSENQISLGAEIEEYKLQTKANLDKYGEFIKKAIRVKTIN